MVYIPGDYQLEKFLRKVPHYKVFKNARSTLGLELARFKFGEVHKKSLWWKQQLAQQAALRPVPMKDLL